MKGSYAMGGLLGFAAIFGAALYARGVISVTERQAYIGRVRALAKACADAFVQTRAGGHTDGEAA